MKLTDRQIEHFYRYEKARHDVRLITTANFLGLVALKLNAEDDDQSVQRAANQLAEVAEEYDLSPDDLQKIILGLEPAIESAA